MKYHKTRDILHVMQMFGRKNIMNTPKHMQFVEFGADEYASKATSDSDETRQLVEAGFEYVCTMPLEACSSANTSNDQNQARNTGPGELKSGPGEI